MFKNTLLLTLRGLRKDVGFNFINITGLAIGLAACLMILVFVSHEVSYDRHYDRADDIYRIVIKADIGGSISDFAIAPYAAYPHFRDKIAAIENGVRVQEFDGQVVVDDRNFEEDEVLLADTSFFEVFNQVFQDGSSAESLDEPGSVVITTETANRLFGREDVMGEPLVVNDIPMTVTGIVETPTRNSHLTFDYVASLMNLPPVARTQRDGLWYNIGMYSYVLIPQGTDKEQIVGQMEDIVEEEAGEMGRNVGISYEFDLQPLTDIHLHSNLQAEFGVNGDATSVLTFTIIALFILLIACINFTNLSTARSTIRAKEVGVRKALGAAKGDLVARFLTESFMTVLISSIIAAVLTILALGWLSNVTNRTLTFESLMTPGMILSMIGLVVVCGFAAGAYPAFVLSAFQPVEVLRGQVTGIQSKSRSRQGMVILQFVVSIVLITGTLVIRQQVEFMKHKPLGFDREGVGVITMDTSNDPTSWESFRQTLLESAAITRASFASGVPGRTGELRLFVPEGRDSTQTFATTVARVDQDYVTTYGMTMATGRFFSRDFPSDSSNAFVVNEAAARQYGWTPEDAVGKTLEWRGVQKSNVIGVVSDYHFRPLTEEIAPLVFYLERQPRGLLSVRFASGAERTGVDFIREAWQKFEGQRPLDFLFVDEDLSARYQEQEAQGGLITTFALLAIFIASLGLFGLASFAVQRRTKEIGIRKVLGATVSQLVVLVTREFVVLLVFAAVVAWPLAWFLLSNYWLDQFPYRIEMGPIPFIVAGILALVLTIIATFYHSVTAARADPVKSLRFD